MDRGPDRARVTVCGTCADGAGRALAARIAAAAPGLGEVRVAPCLMACGRPLALAVAAPGKATYLFAGVDAATAAADVAAFVALFDAAPDGEIADARPCGALRFRLIGRIPSWAGLA